MSIETKEAIVAWLASNKGVEASIEMLTVKEIYHELQHKGCKSIEQAYQWVSDAYARNGVDFDRLLAVEIDYYARVEELEHIQGFNGWAFENFWNDTLADQKADMLGSGKVNVELVSAYNTRVVENSKLWL